MMDSLDFMIGLIMLLILGLIFYIAYLISDYSCASKWNHFPHSYGMIQGCMIDPNGKGLIPAANYRVL